MVVEKLLPSNMLSPSVTELFLPVVVVLHAGGVSLQILQAYPWGSLVNTVNVLSSHLKYVPPSHMDSIVYSYVPTSIYTIY